MFLTKKFKEELIEIQKEKKNLERDIENMTATISSYDRQIKDKKEELKIVKGEISDSIQNQIYDANFSFDFRKMNAFSVERIKRKDDEFPVTVIGYTYDSKIREWFFYCSFDTHNSLVEEFNLWKNNCFMVSL